MQSLSQNFQVRRYPEGSSCPSTTLIPIFSLYLQAVLQLLLILKTLMMEMPQFPLVTHFTGGLRSQQWKTFSQP